MRIACVHIPQLSLQCATRVDPSLRGAAVAVVGSGLATGRDRLGLPAALTTPVVLACSRAAWGLGVRVGMTATTARALHPGELRLVTAEPHLERETVRAIAEALLGASPTVDVGGRLGVGGAHLAMYAEVPAKTRGASFGERVREVLEALGLVGRVGIADDRFTAWVAAADGGSDAWEHAVVTVPRGGSAAFLSPRPLGLLSITPEVQHMLEALGVRTLGQFASLPAPTAGRRVDRQAGGDFQALARGESGSSLRPYAPEGSLREEIALEGPDAGLGGLSAIGTLAQRVALRLAGRERLAGTLEVSALAADGSGARERVLIVELDHATSDVEQLTAAIVAAVARAAPRDGDAAGGELAPGIARAAAAIQRLRVVVSREALGSDAAAIASASVRPVVLSVMDEPVTALSALSVVLSSTGTGDLFDHRWAHEAARPAWDGRREVHRRTRRGKQRRRVLPTAVQPRLFDRSSS